MPKPDRRIRAGGRAVADPIGRAGIRYAKYPDWKGQWIGGWTKRFPGVTGQPSYDPHKSDGRGQQAPLTPEYQAVFEASLADQAAGGPGNEPQFACLPSGMPRMMIAYYPMEIVITPDTTHLLMEHIHNFRRIYTDGRDWPEEILPSFAGYSIGKWVDEDRTGRYGAPPARSPTPSSTPPAFGFGKPRSPRNA